jgi:hypothetical protein
MVLPVIAPVPSLCNCNYMSTQKQKENVKEEEAPGNGEKLCAWFAERIPGGWFSGAPEVLADREEITVVGELPAGAADAAHGDAELDALVLERSRRFREETRDARIALAREAEALFGRKVSWGVRCEGRKVMFTTLSVPVMTRLRQAERRVLDTLVDAGVARSRSDALAWCVRLVGQHEDAWLADLREALRRVEHIRAGGPRA